MKVSTVNPYSEKLLSTYKYLSDQEVLDKINSSKRNKKHIFYEFYIFINKNKTACILSYNSYYLLQITLSNKKTCYVK